MKNYFISLFVALLVSSTSCESMVDDLNVNPNNPTDASADLMLTGVQLANITVHEGHTDRVAGMWSGYFTGIARQYPDFSSYNANGATFDQVWQNVYAGVVQNGNVLISKAEMVNNQLLMGITKVMQAHALQVAASCWGDVPFSQTADIEEYPNPVFDAQTDVYAGVQQLLDEAIAMLESGIGSSPEGADIHFGGNAAPWIEVAYTLKARAYLETKDYSAAYEAAQRGISLPENSLMAPHGTVNGGNRNLMNDFLAGGRAGDMSSQNAYITQVLSPVAPLYKGNAKTDESARFHYYFLNTEDFEEITPNTSSAEESRGIYAIDASFPLVTYQENLLILAEAAARAVSAEEGLVRLNAFREYMNGGGYIDPTYLVENAYQYAPYTAEDFVPGGIANAGEFSQDEALLHEILRERYVTFFGQKQGFSDIRRTRNESFGVHPPPTAGNSLPERFIYSQSEINSNTNAPSPVPGIFEVTPINQTQ